MSWLDSLNPFQNSALPPPPREAAPSAVRFICNECQTTNDIRCGAPKICQLCGVEKSNSQSPPACISEGKKAPVHVQAGCREERLSLLHNNRDLEILALQQDKAHMEATITRLQAQVCKLAKDKQDLQLQRDQLLAALDAAQCTQEAPSSSQALQASSQALQASSSQALPPQGKVLTASVPDGYEAGDWIAALPRVRDDDSSGGAGGETRSVAGGSLSLSISVPAAPTDDEQAGVSGLGLTFHRENPDWSPDGVVIKRVKPRGTPAAN